MQTNKIKLRTMGFYVIKLLKEYQPHLQYLDPFLGQATVEHSKCRHSPLIEIESFCPVVTFPQGFLNQVF